MAIRLRKPKPQPNGAFHNLVNEYLTVEKEWRKLNTLSALKLTPQAYVKAAWHVAGDPPLEHRQKVRAAIERPATFEASEAAAAYRRAIAAVRSPNFPWPPRELRRLNYLLTAGGLAELAVLNANTFELLALAAETAAEKHPEDFGSSESQANYEQRVLELTMQRDELKARIAKEWGPQDVRTSAPDSQDRVKLTFVWAGVDTGVSVYPTENAAEQLGNWLLAHEQKE